MQTIGLQTAVRHLQHHVEPEISNAATAPPMGHICTQQQCVPQMQCGQRPAPRPSFSLCLPSGVWLGLVQLEKRAASFPCHTMGHAVCEAFLSPLDLANRSPHQSVLIAHCSCASCCCTVLLAASPELRLENWTFRHKVSQTVNGGRQVIPCFHMRVVVPVPL
jgi:hypothetical protein